MRQLKKLFSKPDQPSNAQLVENFNVFMQELPFPLPTNLAEENEVLSSETELALSMASSEQFAEFVKCKQILNLLQHMPLSFQEISHKIQFVTTQEFNAALFKLCDAYIVAKLGRFIALFTSNPKQINLTQWSWLQQANGDTQKIFRVLEHFRNFLTTPGVHDTFRHRLEELKTDITSTLSKREIELYDELDVTLQTNRIEALKQHLLAKLNSYQEKAKCSLTQQVRSIPIDAAIGSSQSFEQMMHGAVTDPCLYAHICTHQDYPVIAFVVHALNDPQRRYTAFDEINQHLATVEIPAIKQRLTQLLQSQQQQSLQHFIAEVTQLTEHDYQLQSQLHYQHLQNDPNYTNTLSILGFLTAPEEINFTTAHDCLSKINHTEIREKLVQLLRARVSPLSQSIQTALAPCLRLQPGIDLNYLDTQLESLQQQLQNQAIRLELLEKSDPLQKDLQLITDIIDRLIKKPSFGILAIFSSDYVAQCREDAEKIEGGAIKTAIDTLLNRFASALENLIASITDLLQIIQLGGLFTIAAEIKSEKYRALSQDPQYLFICEIVDALCNVDLDAATIALLKGQIEQHDTTWYAGGKFTSCYRQLNQLVDRVSLLKFPPMKAQFSLDRVSHYTTLTLEDTDRIIGAVRTHVNTSAQSCIRIFIFFFIPIPACLIPERFRIASGICEIQKQLHEFDHSPEKEELNTQQQLVKKIKDTITERRAKTYRGIFSTRAPETTRLLETLDRAIPACAA